VSESSKEQAARLRKQRAKKESSLSIKIMESNLYDWNPTARFLLLVIAQTQVTNEDAYFPEDCPDEYKNDRLGWCWMSQWRLALRVGISEPQVRRWIKRFEDDDVIQVRVWKDDNKADHNLSRVNESVVEAHQRPSQTKDVERSSRYKKKRGANRGSFTSTNQPRRTDAEFLGAKEAIMDMVEA
jgi:hypothetical protein